jgi:hypothetical protein
MPATVLLIRNVDENRVAACCIAARNNEMIPLIAKYFFRFLHELTVSSVLVTIVPVVHLVPFTRINHRKRH